MFFKLLILQFFGALCYYHELGNAETLPPGNTGWDVETATNHYLSNPTDSINDGSRGIKAIFQRGPQR